MVLTGVLMIVAGLIPIALANREVVFPDFSRYTLISFTGAVLVAAGILWLFPAFFRNLLIIWLISIAVMTQFLNGAKAAHDTRILRDFWWQVAWRAPGIELNTTLIAYYPEVVIQEDYFVWGPANLLYFPASRNPEYIQPGLYASIPNELTVERVLTQEPQIYDRRRGIITYANPRNALILSQPSINSCLHIFDGEYPGISNIEPENIRAMAPFSEIDHVLTEVSPPPVPSIIFGSEPEHGWCYYYQKASLALQKKKWQEIISTYTIIQRLGLSPSDQTEWYPFLEGMVRTHQYKLAKDVIEYFNDSSSVCKFLLNLPELPKENYADLNDEICP
jgi:hypothetical protein